MKKWWIWVQMKLSGQREQETNTVSLTAMPPIPVGRGFGAMGPQMSQIGAAHTLTVALNVYIQWHTRVLNNKTIATKYREDAEG